MKYTIDDFNRQFPNDTSCLEHVFQSKYSHLKGYYRIRSRLAYANRDGKQIHPLKGTIFERSTTPLRSWFFAIYLFSQSRNGVSAKEIQRHIGVTYKTAFRMCHKIRSMMKENTTDMSGIIECDEVFVGGKRRMCTRGWRATKTPVFGIVERNGRIHAEPVENCKSETLIPIITKRVPNKVRIMTDDYASYSALGDWKKRFIHRIVKHSKYEYVRKEGRMKIHTNTIEGAWSGMRRQFNGTHHSVSKGYLPSYLGEICFRYNHRHEVLFEVLMSRISLNPEA